MTKIAGIVSLPGRIAGLFGYKLAGFYFDLGKQAERAGRQTNEAKVEEGICGNSSKNDSRYLRYGFILKLGGLNVVYKDGAPSAMFGPR